MGTKLSLLIGFGAGYVVGTRAGRQRYDQMVGKAQELWQKPGVQEKAQQVQHVAQEKAQQAQHAVQEKAQQASNTVKEKADVASHAVQEKAQQAGDTAKEKVASTTASSPKDPSDPLSGGSL